MNLMNSGPGKNVKNEPLQGYTYIGADEAALSSMGRSFGILIAMLGMGVQWASLHSITFLGTVFDISPVLDSDAAWLVNSASTFSVFLTLFLISRKTNTLVNKRPVCIVVLVCLLMGLCALIIGCYIVPSAPMIYFANVALACGTTPLIVMWGEVYKYLNPKGEQLFVSVGGIVLSVMIYLVEIQLPTEIAIGMFMVLPFASFICLRESFKVLQGSSDTWGPKKKMSADKSPALFFVCIAAFSIPYNYLQSGDKMIGVAENLSEWSSILAIAIVVIAVVALAEIVAERKGILLIPGVVLFLLSLAMFSFLFFGDTSPLLVPSILYSGYYLFLAMVYFALGPLVAMTGTNPIRLFSGAMIANVGGLLFGSFLGNLETWVGVQTASVVVVVITYFIFFLGLMLLNNRSYSLFRINDFNETKYSFEYLRAFDSMVVTLGEYEVSGSEIVEGDTVSFLEALRVQCELVKETHRLSSREYEVLVSLMRGKTLATIAEELFVSENTIKAHTKSIYRKLGVHTREELLGSVEQCRSVT